MRVQEQEHEQEHEQEREQGQAQLQLQWHVRLQQQRQRQQRQRQDSSSKNNINQSRRCQNQNRDRNSCNTETVQDHNLKYDSSSTFSGPEGSSVERRGRSHTRVRPTRQEGWKLTGTTLAATPGLRPIAALHLWEASTAAAHGRKPLCLDPKADTLESSRQ